MVNQKKQRNIPADLIRLQQIPCPIAEGNWKFSWAIKSSKWSARMGNENLSRELNVNWNFVIIFDILTDVNDILFQNKLKVIPLTLFVGSMSQREEVIWFYKQFFNNIKFWVCKSGTIGQLIYSVRLPHGATSWKKLVAAWTRSWILKC